MLIIVIILQLFVIVGLVYVIITRKVPEIKIRERLPKKEEEFKVLDAPTADELLEQDRPKPEVEAENAMRDIFKKISGK